jgi:hypothetical protein
MATTATVIPTPMAAIAIEIADTVRGKVAVTTITTTYSYQALQQLHHFQ